VGRHRFELHDGDLVAIARVLDTDPDSLRGEFERRPAQLTQVLGRQDVVDALLDVSEPTNLGISPTLFFAVLVHRAADQLAASEWVAEWVGPGCRLPVFDVDPLLEFTDAPGRLLFATELLVAFVGNGAVPVPTDRLDLDELVDWLGAVEPADRARLLRLLGDLALFQAGVFPDRTGATPMTPSQAEHLGRSVHLTDVELDHLVDVASPTPGLDALETLSSAWYRAAADELPGTPVLHDVSHRIRAARRFLNFVTDHYLYRRDSGWSFAI
jgi:hypothetical protein